VSRQPLPGVLRTSEVAALLHVKPRTVTHWAKKGLLPHSFTLGGHRRYSETVIRALAAEMQQPDGGGAPPRLP
jgi:excisionase family DNA binding protein